MFKKFVLTSNPSIFDYVIKNGDFKLEKNAGSFEIHSWFLGFDEEGEDVLLALYKWDNRVLFELLSFVFETYNIVKVISLDFAKNLNDFAASPWDVFMPNTFVSDDELPPLFLENVADKNYDLGDFGVLMNWVCYSSITEISEEKEDEIREKAVDIIDDSAYAVVTNSDINNLKDKTIVVRGIDTWNAIVHKNIFEILELIF